MCAWSNSEDRNSWASCCCRTRRAACRAPRAEEATAAPSEASNVARNEEKKSSMHTAFLLDRRCETARPCAASSSKENSRASAASARSVGVDASCGSGVCARCRSSATNGPRPRSACSVALAKHRLPLLTNPRRSNGAADSFATSQVIATGAAFTAAGATRAGGAAPADGAVRAACARASSASAACRRRGFAHGLDAAVAAGAPSSSRATSSAAFVITQARAVAHMRTRWRFLASQGGSTRVVPVRHHPPTSDQEEERRSASRVHLYRLAAAQGPVLLRAARSSTAALSLSAWRGPSTLGGGRPCLNSAGAPRRVRRHARAAAAAAAAAHPGCSGRETHGARWWRACCRLADRAVGHLPGSGRCVAVYVLARAALDAPRLRRGGT